MFLTFVWVIGHFERMSHSLTVERILDAAELLFAEQGFRKHHYDQLPARLMLTLLQ